MSASDVASLPTDQSLLDSLCATLEAKLAAKICASLHRAVTRTVCGTLKEGVHDVLNLGDEPDEDKGHAVAANDAACIREFCPSLEDVIANAVCAALKQTVSDTVCATLKKAIHNTIRDMREAEEGAPLHVSPVEFCFCLEDVIANAICAALKQTVKDTICVPVKKAITHAMHDELAKAQSECPPDSFANLTETCDRVVQTLADKMCTKLQQTVAQTLCPRLRRQVKRTIERHAEELRAEHAVQSTQARQGFRTAVSTHRIAFFAVIGVVIVSLTSAMLIPGMQLPSASSVTIPSVPSLPQLPAAPNVSIPSVPSLPQLPAAPNVSIPSVPSLQGLLASPSESSRPSGSRSSSPNSPTPPVQVVPIRMQPLTTAQFSAAPTSGYVPLSVSFTDHSTGTGPLTYQWNFGDGTTSSAQNPTHHYTGVGRYTVTLTVTGPGGTSTATNYITTSAKPVQTTAQFSAAPTSGTAPLTVRFTDQSTGTGPLTYKWDFGDGTTSSAQNPIHPYNVAAPYPTYKYAVTLTVTGPGGTSTATNFIKVEPYIG
jgi:PKD repeat protein